MTRPYPIDHEKSTAFPEIVRHRVTGDRLCIVVDSPSAAGMSLALLGRHDVIELRPNLDLHPTEERWDPKNEDFADELAELFFFYDAVLVAAARERVKDAVCFACVTRHHIRAAVISPRALARAYRNGKAGFSLLASVAVPWHTKFPTYPIWAATQQSRAVAA